MKRKRTFLFSFGLVSDSEEEKKDLKRESPNSLYISRRSNHRFSSEQEEKLIYAARATCGHRFCRVLTTPGGRGLLLLNLFFG